MHDQDLQNVEFLKHNYKACLDIIAENVDQRAVAFAKAVAPSLKAAIEKYGQSVV